MGMGGYISKPIIAEAFRQALARWIPDTDQDKEAQPTLQERQHS